MREPKRGGREKELYREEWVKIGRITTGSWTRGAADADIKGLLVEQAKKKERGNISGNKERRKRGPGVGHT